MGFLCPEWKRLEAEGVLSVSVFGFMIILLLVCIAFYMTFNSWRW